MDDVTTLRVEKVQVMMGVAKSIRDHAQREAEKGGYEAVGFLAGVPGDDRVGAVLPLNNHSSTPDRAFFVEPWEQYRAEQALENAELEIRGLYHSHPVGEATPSAFDQSLARPGELMIIYSVGFGDINGWRETEGQLLRVDLEYVDPDEEE